MFNLFCVQAVAGPWIKGRKAMAFCGMISLTLPMVPLYIWKAAAGVCFIWHLTGSVHSTNWAKCAAAVPKAFCMCMCVWCWRRQLQLVSDDSPFTSGSPGQQRGFQLQSEMLAQDALRLCCAALLDSAAVMAVLPSFLEVREISRENHLCENEDYDTAGGNLSVNGSVSDSWAFSLRYWAGYRCQEHKV